MSLGRGAEVRPERPLGRAVSLSMADGECDRAVGPAGLAQANNHGIYLRAAPVIQVPSKKGTSIN